jgi:phage pi2 protein 07
MFQLITENQMNLLLSKDPTLHDVLNHPDMMKELKNENAKLIN